MRDIHIGDNEKEIEKLFDEFLEHMEQFDRKTSAQKQREILRKAVRPAVLDLRSATRSSFKKDTGRSRRSVRITVKNSKNRPGVQYATYGWSNKGIPHITYRMRNGKERKRPLPATYIGIWQDLGTRKGLRARGIFKTHWSAQKTSIIRSLETQIAAIMRETRISS